MERDTFITDGEFEARFGTQVVEAVKLLGRYAETICQGCGGECCGRVGCDFYCDKFGSCPIYLYRPAKCRLYYCDKVLASESLTQEERGLLDRPVHNLSQVLRNVWGLGLFLEPPVRVGDKSWLTVLGIEPEVRGLVQALRDGGADCSAARDGLVALVLRCRDGA